MERTRYCRRCAMPQTLANQDQPVPCRKCGDINFSLDPPLHSGRGYELIPWVTTDRGMSSDRDFLRVQGIDPGADYGT